MLTGEKAAPVGDSLKIETMTIHPASGVVIQAHTTASPVGAPHLGGGLTQLALTHVLELPVSMMRSSKEMDIL